MSRSQAFAVYLFAVAFAFSSMSCRSIDRIRLLELRLERAEGLLEDALDELEGRRRQNSMPRADAKWALPKQKIA
jgi:signal transduction protein with GAF and PtsI domain